MYSQANQSPDLSPAYVRAILNLIATTHGILDAFLSMSSLVVRAAPIIHYIRVCYAMSLLLELYMSSRRQGNELNKIVDADALQFEKYMSSLLSKLDGAAGKERCRAPEKFGFVLKKMLKWYSRQHGENISSDVSEQDLRPLANLKMDIDTRAIHIGSTESPSLQKLPTMEESNLHHDNDTPDNNTVLEATDWIAYNNADSVDSSEIEQLRGTFSSKNGAIDDTRIFQHSVSFEDSAFMNGPPFQIPTDAQIPMSFDEDLLFQMYSTSDDISNSLVPDMEGFEYMDESLLDSYTVS